jgi:hypothetical protein
MVVHNLYLELCALVEKSNTTPKNILIVYNRNRTENGLKLNKF